MAPANQLHIVELEWLLVSRRTLAAAAFEAPTPARAVARARLRPPV
jgi:hypothetical protein